MPDVSRNACGAGILVQVRLHEKFSPSLCTGHRTRIVEYRQHCRCLYKYCIVSIGRKRNRADYDAFEISSRTFPPLKGNVLSLIDWTSTAHGSFSAVSRRLSEHFTLHQAPVAGMYPYCFSRRRAFESSSLEKSSCHFAFSTTIASTVRSSRPRS